MTARTAGAAAPPSLRSALRVTPVEGRADLDRFIRLPAKLYNFVVLAGVAAHADKHHRTGF